MSARRIKPGERIPITFSARDRVLVLEHTFAGGEILDLLEAARVHRGRCVVKYTLDDLDELLGYVAAEANHSKSKKLRAELDALHDRLQSEMQAYDDGLWQDSAVSLGPKPPKVRGRTSLSIVKGAKEP